MLVAAAVCPCPPLLVPEVAVGAAPELAAARTACADAIGVLAAARPDRLVVVGPAGEGERGPHHAGAIGSFSGFGAAISVRLGTGEPQARPLPTSLTVGAWLLDRARWAASPVAGLGVDEALDSARCRETGREIAAEAPRIALLVMSDGSACRSLKAPGYLDERAEGFDALAARALGSADLAALRTLDASLAHELKAAGRAPWQVLAGAAEGAGLDGRLLYDAAPYGVGYFVATWS
ncbi:class III extradiol dioxygenase subunit B-like domain-containing protein [Streptomyces albipurpureus]|uniref:Class III extradiol dioxygenase subunit B-like domain-containing protein n=1 Tax=Streptomyces albipurpureus TaxID=2897419 RepID=A0ABT0UMD9_9ACTN|nr:class III extradiol dioxygenase subunit B-like domain-containing protein [Streptomyces sp. CWNU-1]MCM2388421.1 class III extradiol dioxygenase subunit B-like domain-containing protein [Streptomyces sp. CWNU-1]